MKKITLILSIFILQYSNIYSKPSKKDYLITIKTSFGDIILLLYDDTPLHKDNFIKLVNRKFYDSTTFHRIIPNFMIQGGDPNSKDTDPNNDGLGGPGYTVPAEFVAKYTHVQGAVCAARMGDQVNPKKESSGSQFYIVDGAQGAHFLNNNYTVFGQVINGIEVVQKISSQPKDARDRPQTNIKIVVTATKMKKKKITKIYGWKYPVS
ncbi:MAG: peptidylprolyl isomerase [Cytophagales bacterium]|nr:peptidylprolyl isomerase [Cytophagales bacterium]